MNQLLKPAGYLRGVLGADALSRAAVVDTLTRPRLGALLGHARKTLGL